MDFKCLYCLDTLKHRDLICTTSCEHFIHEWCITKMKEANEHQCKICYKFIIVESNFNEFDLSQAVTIEGIKVIIEKLDDLIKLTKSRENTIMDLSKNLEEITDKVEGLAIEHHALKFEKKEMEKRMTNLEILRESSKEI